MLRRSLIPVILLLALAGSAGAGASQAPKPYRILVTNDDGVRAPGILALAEALRPLGR